MKAATFSEMFQLSGIAIAVVKLFFMSRTLFFLNGPFPASFSLVSSFQYTVDSKQIFANDRIRTADLWNQN